MIKEPIKAEVCNECSKGRYKDVSEACLACDSCAAAASTAARAAFGHVIPFRILTYDHYCFSMNVISYDYDYCFFFIFYFFKQYIM